VRPPPARPPGRAARARPRSRPNPPNRTSSPGSCLRSGAMSLCATTSRAAIPCRATTSRQGRTPPPSATPGSR
jgi:hypothetical protein